MFFSIFLALVTTLNVIANIFGLTNFFNFEVEILQLFNKIAIWKIAIDLGKLSLIKKIHFL